MKIQVLHNQTLLDIAIMETGNVLSVFDYAILNSISITEALTPGDYIETISVGSKYENETATIVLTSIKNKEQKVIVYHNQNLLDISIQENGDVFSFFDLAIKNKLSFTDELVLNSVLLNDSNTLFKNESVLNYLKKNDILIATNNNIGVMETNIYDYAFPGEFPFSF